MGTLPDLHDRQTDLMDERPAQGKAGSTYPLMTFLGVIGGEVLSYLESHSRTTLRRMIEDLPWPAVWVMMAMGALIRQGLVRGIQHGADVIIESVAVA